MPINSVVAINDVLPIKAARCNASSNLQCFGAPGHQQPNFDGCIRSVFGRLIWLTSAPFTSFCLAKFGWAPFGDFRVQTISWQWSMQNSRSVDKNSGTILSHLCTRVHEIFGQCRGPLVFCNSLAGVSMARFIHRTFTIKSRSRQKPNSGFWLQIFCEGWSRLFYGRLSVWFTSHHLAKLSWVPFADLRLRRLAMKRNVEFMEGG